MPGIALDICKFIDAFGIEDQGLFTYGVGASQQGKPAMGVMKVIRRTDRSKIDFSAVTTKIVDVAIELLKLYKKSRVWKMAIENPDGVVWVIGHNQVATRFGDRTHMTRCNITASADQSV